jgi:hypothetical protein
MRLNWQDALALLIAEQAAEAAIRSMPPGRRETISIPPVILRISGRRVELTGFEVRIPAGARQEEHI